MKKVIQVTLLLLIMIGSSSYCTYIFLNDYIATDYASALSNTTLVKVHTNDTLVVNVDGKKVVEEKIDIKREDIKDITYFDYEKEDGKISTQIISNDEDGYNNGFISKKVEKDIVFLYSHDIAVMNTFGTWAFNGFQIGSTIKASNGEYYKVTEIQDEKITGDDIKVGKRKNLAFIYFTCHPNNPTKRRLFYFNKL